MIAHVQNSVAQLRQQLNNSATLSDVEQNFKATVKMFYDYQNENYTNWFYVIIWNFLKDIDRLFGFFAKSWNQRLVRSFANATKCKELDQLLRVQEDLNELSDTISARKLQITPPKPSNNKVSGNVWETVKNYTCFLLLNVASICAYYFFIQSIYASVMDFCLTIGLRNVALISTLIFSSLCVIQMALVSGFSGSLWDQVKKTLSPRRFNWNQFFREVLRKSGWFLLSVYILWLEFNPVWTVGYFFLNLACYSLLRFVQTLAEELVFRRPLLDEKIDPITKSVVGLFQSVFFALGHYYTLAASWCESLWDYVICFAYHFVMGLFHTIQTLCSGGIELAWGCHLAHNLRIDMYKVLFGLQDCSDQYKSSANEVPETANDGQKSPSPLKASAWDNLVMPSICCYATELLFRPRCYVKPVRQFGQPRVGVPGSSSLTGPVAV